MRYKDKIQVLSEVFKHSEFRGDQAEVIDHVMSKKHALVLMPTGMGKSLCYQIPALLQNGLTVVISPLIALMKDQADQARKRGVKCVEINSSLSREEREKRYARLRNKEYELIYVAPERFRNEDFLNAIKENGVSLLAIDEAHCISEWGHDFRPDYTRIKEFREFLKKPTTIALTATATEDVQKDILKQMGLSPDEVKTFNSGLMRPNLHLSIHDLYGMDQKVQKFILLRNYWKGPAIVYFSLVQTLETFSALLGKAHIEHVIYHGQLPRNKRETNQNRFLTGKDDLILATPAFGLGIDKKDVRMVLHAEIPASIEAYYQEIGRAGRDGKISHCHLLYDEDDVTIQMDFLKWAHPDPGFINSVYNLIASDPVAVNQQGYNYLREKLNFYNSRDFRVETTMNLLERWGFIKGDLESKDVKPMGRPTGHLVDKDIYGKKLKYAQEKLLKMVQYTKHEHCLMKYIYEYFGLKDAKACGHCDNCLDIQGTDRDIF